MPRIARVAPAGFAFHVVNRGNDGRKIFRHAGDYQAFLSVMSEVQLQIAMPMLAYCLMPNHWHLVLRPGSDGDLGRFMQRLTTTHVRRWHQHRRSVGRGHLYQGTYKSFLIQEDEHFLTVVRYVERNALRAGLVTTSEHWQWSSLAQRSGTQHVETAPVLSRWPVEMPRNWSSWVDEPQTEAELEAIRTAARRGRPFGEERWTQGIAEQFGLQFTLRRRGRPRKNLEGGNGAFAKK